MSSERQCARCGIARRKPDTPLPEQCCTRCGTKRRKLDHPSSSDSNSAPEAVPRVAPPNPARQTGESLLDKLPQELLPFRGYLAAGELNNLAVTAKGNLDILDKEARARFKAEAEDFRKENDMSKVPELAKYRLGQEVEVELRNFTQSLQLERPQWPHYEAFLLVSSLHQIWGWTVQLDLGLALPLPGKTEEFETNIALRACHRVLNDDNHDFLARATREARRYIQRQANVLVSYDTLRWLVDQVSFHTRWRDLPLLRHLDPEDGTAIPKCLDVEYAEYYWESVEPQHPALPLLRQTYLAPAERQQAQVQEAMHQVLEDLKYQRADLNVVRPRLVADISVPVPLFEQALRQRTGQEYNVRLSVQVSSEGHTLLLALSVSPHKQERFVLQAVRTLDPWRSREITEYIQGHVALFVGQRTLDWLCNDVLNTVPRSFKLKKYLDPTQADRDRGGRAQEWQEHCPLLESVDPPHPEIRGPSARSSSSGGPAGPGGRPF